MVTFDMSAAVYAPGTINHHHHRSRMHHHYWVGGIRHYCEHSERSMPTNRVQFRERSVRRVIRAAQKEGLVTKSATIAPDGTITVSLAEPSQREVSLDVSRDIDDIVENEWHAKAKK
jgi:hypothetical protein